MSNLYFIYFESDIDKFNNLKDFITRTPRDARNTVENLMKKCRWDLIYTNKDKQNDLLKKFNNLHSLLQVSVAKYLVINSTFLRQFTIIPDNSIKDIKKMMIEHFNPEPLQKFKEMCDFMTNEYLRLPKREATISLNVYLEEIYKINNKFSDYVREFENNDISLQHKISEILRQYKK